MFIFTAKLHRGRLIAAAAVICGVVAAAVLMRPSGAAVAATVSPRGIRTGEDRVAYLESFGWKVNPEPVSVEELVIPEEFDQTYSQYLQLQTDQGFDLSRYQGKRVRRYAYEITNYPTGESGIWAELLICKNTVIGGEVLSPQPDGFIHALTMPS